MARNDALKLRTHMAARGFKFGLSPAKVEQALRRSMGAERYASYLNVCDAIAAGQASPEDRYRVPQTAAEANLLMSHQADIALAAAAELYRVVEPMLTPGSTVLDLGCWTGAMASFIAVEHPDVHCCGVDGVLSVIACAQEQGTAPNLRYFYWNYSAAPPEPLPRGDVLISAFGIDFEHRTPQVVHSGWPLDIAELRESPAYRYRHEEALRYLTNWRAAAHPAASLAVILRLPSVYHAIAILDAAAVVGWCWDRERSSFVTVGNERFPCFVFAEGPRASVDLDQVLAWWCAREMAQSSTARAAGASAWVRRRSLDRARVAGVYNHRYEDGTEQRVEVGRVGDNRWYGLLTATNGAAQYGEFSSEELRSGLVVLPDELYDAVMREGADSLTSLRVEHDG